MNNSVGICRRWLRCARYLHCILYTEHRLRTEVWPYAVRCINSSQILVRPQFWACPGLRRLPSSQLTLRKEPNPLLFGWNVNFNENEVKISPSRLSRKKKWFQNGPLSCCDLHAPFTHTGSSKRKLYHFIIRISYATSTQRWIIYCSSN